MPATVTLNTATLPDGIDERSARIKVSSTANMTTGVRLYIDKELMTVLRLDVDPWIIVTRGADGTPSIPHAGGSPIFIGRADQFFYGPPVGRPQPAILVSPYIDVTNGNVYFAQGDSVPGSTAPRWWQAQTVSYGIGPLGVRTTTLDPTSST